MCLDHGHLDQPALTGARRQWVASGSTGPPPLQRIVLYVDDPLLAAVMAARTTAPSMIAATEADLQRFVTGAFRGATPAPDVTIMTRPGTPAREIVAVAKRHGCDLIVIGYRGVGRTSRLLFGSTTEGVMRTTAVPVVAIPPARGRARLPAATRRTLKRAS